VPAGDFSRSSSAQLLSQGCAGPPCQLFDYSGTYRAFWPTERSLDTLADMGIGAELDTDHPGLDCPICGHRRY